MILCNARRFGRVRLLSNLCALAGLCALSFAIGCNGGKATGASQPASAATTVATVSPNDELKYLCKSAAFHEDHYFVDLDAKKVRTDSGVKAGANMPSEWTMTDVSITEDAIKFTQKIDFGAAVLVRTVSIGRKDGSFTNNGKTDGKCAIVQKF